MKIYTVNEIEAAAKVLVAFKDGVFIPEPQLEADATKLAAAAVAAALSIIATGLGEIIAEHERANSAN